jgi:hypothetical protein
MSSRRWRFFVDDILTAISQIQSYVQEISFEEFCQNDLLLSAVERKFIIIGEAARHIPIHVLDVLSFSPVASNGRHEESRGSSLLGSESTNPMGHGPQ